MRYFIIFLFLQLTYLFTFSQTRTSFSIDGSINGIPDGTKIYLIFRDDFGNADTAKFTTSESAHFRFQGNLDAPGKLCFIKLDTTHFKLSKISNRRRQSWFRLMLDNSDVKIHGDTSSWPNVKISGSRSTDQYDSISNLINNYIAVVQKSLPREGSPDSTATAKLANNYNSYFRQLLLDRKDQYAAALFASMLGLPVDTMQSIYNNLTDKVKTSDAGSKLRKTIEVSIIQKNVAEGKIIPDFNIHTIEDKPVSIRSLISSNKLTLIDFWASWCTPCRKEIPTLKKIFEDYKEKGFNIISISSDKNRLHWKKALDEENMPWFNTIEIVYQQITSGIFGMKSIPAYILVDKSGKLLAYNCGYSQIKNFGPDIRSDLSNTIKDYFKP